MDKSQKELIKTYYRKRGIAAEQGENYKFMGYEINDFSLKNKLIPQKELDKILVSIVDDNNVEGVKSAIQNGADVNGVDDNNWTPLITASYNDNLEIVKLLTQLGADVNKTTSSDHSALTYGTYNDNLDIVKILIQLGADINARNGTPLLLARARDNSHMVNLLIKAGAK